jgi:iron complex outermembrane recepter protein
MDESVAASQDCGLRSKAEKELKKLWQTLGFAGAIGFLCIAEVQAQEEGERFDLGAIEIVEVEAERLNGWNDPMQPSVSSEDIRRFERKDLAEAVSLLPGVEVQNIGGRSERLVYVRGFNSRQVPLFIDGIPVYVPYDGNIDLSRFTTFDIAEVSVTKGFTSMLYGANTLGGSINAITRKPEAEIEAEAGLGARFDRDHDFSGHEAFFNAGTNQGRWYAQVGASSYERKFFTLSDDFRPVASEDGERRDNSETQDKKISLRLGLTPGETSEYALSYYRQMGEKQTPSYAGDNPDVRTRYWQWPEYDKESLYFNTRHNWGEDFSSRLRLYYDKFDNTLRSFDDDSFTTQARPYAFNSVYDDYAWGSSLELGTERIASHDLRLAMHYKVDVHRESDGGSAPQERYEDRMSSIGVEDRVTIGRSLTLIAGASYDQLRGEQADNIEDDTVASFALSSESASNGQLGILYSFSDSVSGRLSVAKRTRFPTIKDRYSFRLGSAIPNPDLAPEEGVNYEIGLNGQGFLGRHSRFDWGAAAFYGDLSESIESVEIDASACTSSPCSQLQNLGETTMQGFEGQLTVSIAEVWEYHFNYSYLDRDNNASPNIKPLDTPQHSAFTYLSYRPADNWHLTASARYNSERYSSTEGDRVAKGFVVSQVKAAWQLSPHWQAEFGVANLADRLYAYEEGFYESGRSYFVNVRWKY